MTNVDLSLTGTVRGFACKSILKKYLGDQDDKFLFDEKMDGYDTSI